jgi:hypothetical protein
MAAARQRSDDVKALESVLAMECDKHGKSFTRYSEATTLGNAVFDRKEIEKKQELLKTLRNLQSNMAFKKSSLRKAFTGVAQSMKRKKTWKFSKEEQKDWVTTMADRTFNLVGHFARSLRSKRDWALKLTGSADNDDDAEEEEEDADEGNENGEEEEPDHDEEVLDAEEEQEVDGKAAEAATGNYDAKGENAEGIWEYKWSDELKLGNRIGHGKFKGKDEVSLPIEIPEGADDADRVQAKWRDGATYTFDITIGEYKGQAIVSRRGDGVSAYWTGEHVDTHNTLTLQQRTDRMQLLSLYDQGAQILQVPLYKFGDLPLPQPGVVPDDLTALKKAVDFMMPFCLIWQKNECQDKNILRDMKNNKLKELDLPTRCPPEYQVQKVKKDPVAKRPAAAAAGGGGKKPRAATAGERDGASSASTATGGAGSSAAGDARPKAAAKAAGAPRAATPGPAATKESEEPDLDFEEPPLLMSEEAQQALGLLSDGSSSRTD